MRLNRIALLVASSLATFLTGEPLFAQLQIGGGVCSSASLSGAYSLTLTGRDVTSQVTYSKVTEGVGTATFDGLSKVTFALTANANSAFGTAQTLSGTYSFQSNCIGTLTITSGDSATFSLESYNNGKNFLLTGQDGTYAYTGNGGTLPATCSAALLTGAYAFNGSGFGLTSGAITGINNISGTLQFDGKSAVSLTWYVSTGAINTTDTVSGQFAVAAGCTGTATVSDSQGNTYSLQLTITSTNGSNFVIAASNSQLMFIGSGRIL